jgi:hypothetical protein
VTITPYGKLGSEDILSAHINGLQYGINNIETVLNMKTATKTAQTLAPVIDMDDNTLRYRIYEASDRNWLASPAPVIYKNGVQVSSSQYAMQPAYGVVVFTAPQLSTDVITADFTHVTNDSTRIDDMQVQTDKVSGIDTRLTKAEATIARKLPKPAGLWYTHSNGNAMAGYATGVAVGVNRMEAFPIVFDEQVTLDKMRVNISAVAGTLLKMGIYSDNNGYPNTKIAETAEVDTTTTGYKEVAFTTGNVTLQAGIYWLVRWQNGGLSISDGMRDVGAINIPDPLDATTLDASGTTTSIGAFAITITYDSILRNPFPSIASGAKYFRRTSYASPWVHVLSKG